MTQRMSKAEQNCQTQSGPKHCHYHHHWWRWWWWWWWNSKYATRMVLATKIFFRLFIQPFIPSVSCDVCVCVCDVCVCEWWSSVRTTY